MSNYTPMPTMYLEDYVDESVISEAAASQAVAIPESRDDHHASSELCCSECCPFCLVIIVQSVSAIPCGDNEKVVNSDPVIQSISIKSIIPPPKA